jgi:hypothetical protein
MPTTTHITNQGNQTISGFKIFAAAGNNIVISGTSDAEGLIKSLNSNLTIEGANSTYGIYFADDGTYIRGNTEINNNLSAQTGTFEKLYANNLVYNTGDQTISGFKNFPNGITSILEDEYPASTTLSYGGISIFNGDNNTVVLDGGSLRCQTETFTIKTEDNDPLYLGTNNQNRLTITPNGNIGIGNDDPSEKLEVVGNIIANNLMYNTGDQTVSGIKNFTNNLVIENNLFSISQASGYLSGSNYDGNYNGGIFIGRTRLSQATSTLMESSFGLKWDKSAAVNSVSRNWSKVAISDVGKYQVGLVYGGTIYVSDNYGSSWKTKISIVGNANWIDASISSDGKYVSAVADGGSLWVSDSYGTNWTNKNITSNWKSIILNSDGQYQIAVNTNNTTSNIYSSKNYGLTWSFTSINGAAYGAGISSDGRYQRIALYSNLNSRYSNDYGNTWLTTSASTTGNLHTKISSDGKIQILADNNYVKISKDYGNVWSNVFKTTKNIKDISISANAHFQGIAVQNDYIYISNNYGASGTWSPVGESGNWQTIDINGNGKYLVAAISGATSGFVFTSKTDEQVRGDLYADNLVYNAGNQTISGVKTFDVFPIVSGNKLITGVDLSSYATTINLASTGSTLDNKINNLSGVSVLTFGNQTINGNKTFTNTGTFNSGIDLNNSNLINATPQIINLSANFNISGNYNSRMIMVNSATEVTGRIVSGNTLGFNTTITQIGAGKIFITGSGIGVTIGSYNNQYKTAGQFATVSVLHTGSNGYIMYGNTAS